MDIENQDNGLGGGGRQEKKGNDRHLRPPQRTQKDGVDAAE